MSWEKQGRIIDWQAQCPVVDKLEDRWRIYYSHRDDNGHSRLQSFDSEVGIPWSIRSINECSILPLGKPGTFDEHGIMPSCIINVGSSKHMYYVGWSQRKSVPYANAIGLAISNDNGDTWKKYSEGPVIGQDAIDPYFVGTFCVEEWPINYIGYYLSCIKWEDNNPVYNIKSASSTNGLSWEKDGQVEINLNVGEGGICSVTIYDNEMWYCYRGKTDFRGGPGSYRIGYALKNDEGGWQRQDDKAGITVSPEGWDSEMICYPYVIEHNGKLFMFYNGNGFGKTGIGYATKQL